MLRVRDGIQAVVAGLLVAGALVLLGCPQDDPGPGTQTVATPTVSPSAGTYSPTITVSLSCATSGASIHYTLDGSNPTTNSNLYNNSPITISATTTLKAIAVKNGMNNSAILTATYTINTGNPQPQTVATPVANPNGGTYTEAQSVTLSCSTSGASIYYTIDGNTPTASSTLYSSAITINGNTTLKAIAVKSGMNNSAVMSATYTIGNAVDTINDINLGVGVTGTLVTYATGPAVLTINNYTDPTTITAINITDPTVRTALSGNDVEVHIASNNGGTVSLTYVHYLRQALQTAVGTGKSVTISSNLTPVFDGRDWWTYDIFTNDPNSLNSRNLYKDYSKTTEIMNNITVVKNDSKYEIVYDRTLRISRPVWQDNNQHKPVPFNGFGLKKGSGSIAPVGGNWGNVTVFGGILYEEMGSNINDYPVVNDWIAYKSALEYAGLHPSQKDSSDNPILLDHSRVSITDLGGTNDPNVVTNGLYNFTLPYGNANLLTRLPGSDKWFYGVSDVVSFDGNVPVTPRTIGNITASATDRKAVAGNLSGQNENGGSKTYQVGEPRADYGNNITVAMAKFMNTVLNIKRFKNTNIIGNGDQWNGTNEVTLPQLINVGLIGDYNSISSKLIITSAVPGVLDITGTSPRRIEGDGYLNLWKVSTLRETIPINFEVVFVRDANGGYVCAGDIGITSTLAKAMIYSTKYSALQYPTNNPYHRAFVDKNNDQIKVTGPMNPAIGTIYLGSDSAQPIPSIVEEDWIKLGNGATSGFSAGVTLVTVDNRPFLRLATNYTNLSTTYKWNNADDFNTNAVASATPPHIDTWLADMPHALLEAVLDNRRRVYGGRG